MPRRRGSGDRFGDAGVVRGIGSARALSHGGDGELGDLVDDFVVAIAITRAQAARGQKQLRRADAARARIWAGASALGRVQALSLQ
jgi:hypothetical protein